MPKETIHSTGTPFVKLDDGNEVAPESVVHHDSAVASPVLQRGISVRWGRGRQEVEIGVHEFEVATGEIVSGHFSSFDRDGLNALVRAARKARDQAFGADA